MIIENEQTDERTIVKEDSPLALLAAMATVETFKLMAPYGIIHPDDDRAPTVYRITDTAYRTILEQQAK